MQSNINSNSIPDISILFSFNEGEKIENQIENGTGEEFVLKIVNASIANQEVPKKKEEDKVEEPIILKQIGKISELYENNYRNLLLLLTTIAPEFLLDCMLFIIF